MISLRYAAIQGFANEQTGMLHGMCSKGADLGFFSGNTLALEDQVLDSVWRTMSSLTYLLQGGKVRRAGPAESWSVSITL
jgi:hypothetical protein